MRHSVFRAEGGSVAPLGIALLLGLVSMILGLAAAGHAGLTATRVQAQADAAILYAHDRVANIDLSSSARQSQLDAHLRRYFVLASAVSGSRPTYSAQALSGESKIRVCAQWRNPLFPTPPRLICRTAIARSFEVID